MILERRHLSDAEISLMTSHYRAFYLFADEISEIESKITELHVSKNTDIAGLNRWLQTCRPEDPYTCVCVPKNIHKPTHISSPEDGTVAVAFGFVSQRAVDRVVSFLSKARPETLILDLRGCSGGDFYAAATLASSIVSGEICTQHYRNHDRTITSWKPVTDIGRIVIVIDSETTSSAEMVAASLFINFKNGVAVGTRTFGKCTGQDVVKLNDSVYFKMTSFTWDVQGIHVNEFLDHDPDRYLEYNVPADMDYLTLLRICSDRMGNLNVPVGNH